MAGGEASYFSDSYEAWKQLEEDAEVKGKIYAEGPRESDSHYEHALDSNTLQVLRLVQRLGNKQYSLANTHPQSLFSLLHN